jgi:8-oxo-dGTP pyrophosphatase MutT (NUDIX family)
MSKNPSDISPESILAAGGIVLGSGATSGKIALVRRRRYRGEIGLPKGKLRKGEKVIDAALREVREETGCRVRVKEREPAGQTHYFVGGTPKTVFYFIMELEGFDGLSPEDTKEIEAVEWVTPKQAAAILTHREDRDLISAVFKIQIGKAK